MKIFIALLVMLVSLSSSLFAAMTCNISSEITDQNPIVKVVNLLCTFDATPGTAVYTLDSKEMGAINSRVIRHIITVPGSTGPTDNSDLGVTEARGSVAHSILSASANGANVVDNATSTGPFYMDGPGSTNDTVIAHSSYPWTVTVTNNAVNNSSFTISLETFRITQ